MAIPEMLNNRSSAFLHVYTKELKKEKAHTRMFYSLTDGLRCTIESGFARQH